MVSQGVAAQGCAVQCVIADQVQKAAKGGRGTDQYLGNLGLKMCAAISQLDETNT